LLKVKETTHFTKPHQVYVKIFLKISTVLILCLLLKVCSDKYRILRTSMKRKK